VRRIPLDEPIRPHGVIRFLLVLAPCIVLRFVIGETSFKFYWFIMLYFPMINWSVYWTMGTVRLGVNKLMNRDAIPGAKLRKFYKWYLNLPGSLVLSELVLQAYLFNR
jgi:hypothetical protein